MEPTIAVAAAYICSVVRSPEGLADAYRLESRRLAFEAAEYASLAEQYAAFAEEAEVVEEFAASFVSLDVCLATDVLAGRSDLLLSESLRFAGRSADLWTRADLVSSRYRGFGRLRVRAMREECRSVLLLPSS